MDKAALLSLLERLDLPEGEYVVMGGACLALRDLRVADDLDLLITASLYEALKQKGWKETATGHRKPYLIQFIDSISIQAFSVWEGPGWQPDITYYLQQPEIIENVPCMPLVELYKWKETTRRNKDLEDLQLINNYLRRSR